VLEVGCGTLGGFVPALLDAGYDAVGVDPEAPEGPGYRQIEFERYEPPNRWTAWWRPCRCITWPTWTSLGPPLLCEGAVLFPTWPTPAKARSRTPSMLALIRAGGIRYAATRA
jgi:hypothetical protein